MKLNFQLTKCLVFLVDKLKFIGHLIWALQSSRTSITTAWKIAISHFYIPFLKTWISVYVIGGTSKTESNIKRNSTKFHWIQLFQLKYVQCIWCLPERGCKKLNKTYFRTILMPLANERNVHITINKNKRVRRKQKNDHETY